MMRTLALSLAATLLPISGVANAAEPPCLTAGEFSSLAGYALPSVISGTSARCRATLGPNAYLPRNGADLAARYSERKAESWTGAKAAFLKLSSGMNDQANKMFRDMPDSSLQPILDSMMEGMISQQIPVERCGTIDNFVRLLAPLPAANTAELIALAVGLGAKSGKAKVGQLSICPA